MYMVYRIMQCDQLPSLYCMLLQQSLAVLTHMLTCHVQLTQSKMHT